jgi:hypothetical protein
MTFLQVSGQSRSVAPAENGVRMDARLPVRLRDVADQRGNLDLLGNRDRLVRFRVPIEIGEPGLAPIAVNWAAAMPSFSANACRQLMASSPVCRMTANVRCPRSS